MICEACREQRHGECRGGSWCDCQHKPPAETASDTEPEERADDRDGGAEPGINWLRQG